MLFMFQNLLIITYLQRYIILLTHLMFYSTKLETRIGIYLIQMELRLS